MTFIKKHVVLICLGLALSLAAYFKFQQVSLADELQKFQKIHDDELNKINAARAEEVAQHKRNEEQLKDALDVVEKQYINAQVALKKKQREISSGVITSTERDPYKLAEKLNEVTGVRIAQ